MAYYNECEPPSSSARYNFDVVNHSSGSALLVNGLRLAIIVPVKGIFYPCGYISQSDPSHKRLEQGLAI